MSRKVVNEYKICNEFDFSLLFPPSACHMSWDIGFSGWGGVFLPMFA